MPSSSQQVIVHNARHSAYAGRRDDISPFVGDESPILELGCYEGAMAAELRRKNPRVTLVGVEKDKKAVRKAAEFFDEIYECDLDALDELRSLLEGREFGAIIAADVLEHLKDPWSTVEVLCQRLSENGRMIISIPNVGHWQLIGALLRQQWPYRQRGIFDSTHLRFFMRRNIDQLVPKGYSVSILKRKYRLIESVGNAALSRLLGMFVGWLPWFREYFVFQYILEIKGASNPPRV